LIDHGLRIPGHYWKNTNNQKHFFDSLAVKLGFKPGEKERWYKVTKEDIINEKYGDSVLRFYGGSWQTALAKIYNLEEEKIGVKPSNVVDEHLQLRKGYNLHVKENRKYWFDQLALQKRIDPVEFSQWHTLKKGDFMNHKECSSILNTFYGGSVSLALSDVYNFIHNKNN